MLGIGIERRIAEDHALIPWLLDNTCLILNACVEGLEGLTSWCRVRGRNSHGQMAGSGEQVFYKLPGKGLLSKPEGNLGPKWEEAAYLTFHHLQQLRAGQPGRDRRI